MSETRRRLTWVLDTVFTLLALWFLLHGEITNALVSWGVSELYSIQRRLPE